jgi:nifR3 family TIM-barrel protein
MSLRSTLNAEVPVAAPGEFAPLTLTPAIRIWPPVVLAPMAGVTNPPFRSLCRRMGAGLYVAEMLHARGLTEGNGKTLRLASFGADEDVRSIQIFGADPQEMHDATRFLVTELGAQHVDVNMGCPVRKITSRGGGSALPARPELMRQVLAAVVRAAGEVPVTTKIRLGLDDETITWREAVRAAAGEGCRWIGVHARTAAQLYSGTARWEELARIKELACSLPAPPGADAARGFPVLGNGDIWEAWDALRMLRLSGCDGVIIGRGCLGRPWLFRELAEVFAGREPEDPPTLGEVLVILREHAGLLVDFLNEPHAMRELRKWCGWYLKGFDGSAAVRDALQRVTSLDQLDGLLAQLDPAQAFPARALRVTRAKRGGTQDSVHLPHGWLDLAARERAAARAGPEDLPSEPCAGEPRAGEPG